MTAYRVANIDKIKKAKKVHLSRSKASEAERLLTESRKRYEKLLFESFPYSYFQNFRVTVFGSSLVKRQDGYFKFIEELTKKLGEEIKVDIITGGGSGLMLAANQGLRDAQQEMRENYEKVDCKNYGIKVDLGNNESGKDNPVDISEKVWNFSNRLEEFIRS